MKACKYPRILCIRYIYLLILFSLLKLIKEALKSIIFIGNISGKWDRKMVSNELYFSFISNMDNSKR